MSRSKIVLALAAALFALPLTGFAQENPADETAPAEEAPEAVEEEESMFSWNAALTSDYVFRGVSQTDEDPALQGGFDLALAHGWYAGVWGSNVDFGDGGPDVEIDTYIGWNHDLTDEWNLDLMLNRYNYIGEDDEFGDGDYNELIGALAWSEIVTLTVGYTNDVYGLSENGWYYGLGGSFELPGGFGLDVGVGRSTFADVTEIEDYTDWSIAVNPDFGPVNVAAGWYDTDSNGEYNFGDTADGRFVLTFSIEG
jgi:uncharacterized protein (TIGR02001 family)